MNRSRAGPAIAVLLVLAFLALWVLWPAHAPAQAPQGAGVVTTLTGNATVARATAPQPLALKFRDDVFLRDRIRTAEDSLLRVLLGGRALVTVRELSVLTLTEEVGRSALDLESGKVAFGVLPQRLRRGDVLEVRTPNAIAAIRGTLVAAQITRPGPRQVRTDLWVLTGTIDVLLRRVPGAGAVRVGPMESISVIDDTLAPLVPLTAAMAAAAVADLKVSRQHTGTPEEAVKALGAQQQAEAAAGAKAAAGRPGVKDPGGSDPTLRELFPLAPPVPAGPPRPAPAGPGPPYP